MISRKRVLPLLLICLLPAISLAQLVSATAPEPSTSLKKSDLAHRQIVDLHDGALLVRLLTKRKSIEGLRERGLEKQAAKVEAEQIKTNQMIVAAFVDAFDFCPIFFVYTDQTDLIKQGKMDQVVFLGHDLQPDSSIRFRGDRFFTAEFGIILPDTSKSVDSYRKTDEVTGTTTTHHYAQGGSMGFGALLIKSDIFVQLRRPFPYYTRTFASLLISRSHKKVVKKMNRHLHKFYNKRKNKTIL